MICKVLKVKCATCGLPVSLYDLSNETLNQAQALVKRGVTDSLRCALHHLNEDAILCQECATACDLDIDEDELGLGAPLSQDEREYFELFFPDKLESRADVDALRQSY